MKSKKAFVLKVLALVLTLMLLIGVLPVSAFADELTAADAEDSFETQVEEPTFNESAETEDGEEEMSTSSDPEQETVAVSDEEATEAVQDQDSTEAPADAKEQKPTEPEKSESDKESDAEDENSEGSDADEKTSDTVAPVLSLVKYSNWDKDEKQTWVKGSDTVSITLKAEDEDSGIDSGSFMIDGKKAEAKKTGNEYTLVLSKKDKVNKDKVTITVSDKAGNVSKPYETVKLLIDDKAPDADDVVSGVFSKYEDAKDRLLKIITFDLVSKNDILFSVTVSANEGSPISKIKLFDTGNELKGGQIKEDKDNYTVDFVLSDKKGAYDLQLYIEDEAGNSTKGKIAVNSLDAISSKDAAIASVGSVYDCVATALGANIELSLSKQNGKASDDATVFSGDVGVGITVSDYINSLKSVKAYQGFTKDFVAKADGSYDLSKLTECALTLDEAKSEKNGDRYTKEVLSFSRPVTDGDGDVRVLVVAESYDSEEPTYGEIDFAVDKDGKPVVENAAQPEKFGTTVPVTFDVTGTKAPVKAADITVLSPNSQKDCTEDQENAYRFSFTADMNGEYQITVKDSFGRSSETAKYKVTKVDNTKPEITITGYTDENKKWQTELVEVSFTVKEPESGIVKENINIESETAVKATEITVKGPDESGVYTCSFKAATAEKYTINVTNGAGSAADPVTTESIKFDDTAPVIEKIVFRQTTAKDAKKFGIYKNAEIAVEVFVRNTGTSPLKEITVKNGGTDLTSTASIVKVDGEENLYSKSFPIPNNNAKEAYKLSFYAEKENGKSHTVNNFADIDVYAEDGETVNLLDNIVKELFEVVITQSGPIVGAFTPDESMKSVENGGKTVYCSSSGTLTAVIEDDFAGIDIDTLSVKLGDQELYPDNVEVEAGFSVSGTSPTSPAPTSPTEIAGQSENSKLTKLTIRYDVAKLKNGETIPTGAYTFTVTAKNLAGNEESSSFTLYMDNTAPKVSDVSFDPEKWTNSDIQVKFKATDDPDSVGFCGGITAPGSFTITGSRTGKDIFYTVEGPDADGKFCFNADCRQDYTIVVTDALGNSNTFTVEEKDVLFDNTPPTITDVKYDGLEYNDSPWQNEQDGVKVSFTVHDKRLVGEEYTDDAQSDVKEVKVTGKDGTEMTLTKEEGGYPVTGYTYSFVSYAYQTYTITAADNAGNPVNTADNSVVTEATKIDDAAPAITHLKLENSVLGDILHVLTFGIYSSKNIIITVEAQDQAPSSGIASITAEYDGEVINESFTATGPNAYDPVEESNTFTIGLSGSSYDPSKLKILVKDNVWSATDSEKHSVEKSFAELNKKELVDYPADSMNETFEIVANENGPVFSEFTLTGNSEDIYRYDADGKTWFSGDIIAQVKASNDLSHLHKATVTLNNTDVTGVSSGTEGYPDYSHYLEESTKKPDDKSFNETTITLQTVNADSLNTTEKDKAEGKNELVVSVESNNGVTNTKTVDFYIDNTNPVIEGFRFTGNGFNRDTDEPGAFDDKLTEPESDNDYGYYFRDETTIYVYASDIGSGIERIYVSGKTVTADDDSHDFAYETVPAVDGDGNAYISYTIEAGFKGHIVAYAVDHVQNESDHKSPDDAIVEKGTKHYGHSYNKISVNTAPVAKDNNNIDLFNGSVSVTLEAADYYSGIRKISYTVIEKSADMGLTPNGATPVEGSVEFPNDLARGAGSYGGWAIASMDKNIVTKASTDITIDSSNFDCNNIQIKITATDRAGNEIESDEKMISIDITSPEIEISYSPESPTNEYNGNSYFNVNRVATITVTERNFNPDDFDLTKFVAHEGTRPSIVGEAAWSTNYSDYSNSSKHTATITFSEDGKFELDCDYTDLAHNAANKRFTPQTFYIDKTNPVLKVSLTSSGSSNNRYYNKTVTANIVITEHNFTSDSPYLTYTSQATGPDNKTSATAPQISSWSGSGDEHTASITFSSDGMYSFKIGFTDLAKNKAEDHNENTFYVDTKADAPVIYNNAGSSMVELKNETAFDGDVAPLIDYTDYNFDISNYTYKLVRHSYNMDEMKQTSEDPEYSSNTINKEFGITVAYASFPTTELADGIYTLEAQYTDKALNTSEPATVVFSVNRYGSVFVLGSDPTAELVDQFYTNDAPNVVIREINVNPVEQRSASVSFNSSNRTLTENKEYTVKATGGATKWYEYIYDISADNFDKEGDYTVTVSSVDTFKNKVTNRTANSKGEIERNCPVSFVVDKTAPVVTISGVEENGIYPDASKTLQIVCMDDNIDKESLVVSLDGQVIDIVNNPAIEVNDGLVGEIDVEYPIEADAQQTMHSIKVDVRDLAANKADDSIESFTLSATFFTMFFHNTVALIVSGALLVALVALAIVLITKKRKIK